MKNLKNVDRPFLFATIALAGIGFTIFISASLGLLARSGAQFGPIAFNQTFFGLILGTIAGIFASRINYRFWRQYAFYFFLASIVLSLLVFVPGLGFSHGGATRWISIGSLTFQPSEILKIGFIIYFAAWLSGIKERVKTFKFGVLPFIILVALVGALLLAEPDTDTFLVITAAGLAMFIVEGARAKHIVGLAICTVALVGVLAFSRPYVMSRINTFLNPTSDPLGASYQIKQSLIAIGSGGISGRGFGQSVQKFNFLPEPIGDSIFAVASEEFGFIGTTFLIIVFFFFGYRGFLIAMRAPDVFSRAIVVGIISMILVQSFLNIGAMLGLLPLSGIPLPFVSHGGTALLFTLVETGIILNISRYQRVT